MSTSPLHAQGTLYLEGSLGGWIAPDTLFESTSNDLSSICDEFINPNAPNIDRCNVADGPSTGGWQSIYESSNGFGGSGEIGFFIQDRARVGLEFNFGSVSFDQTVNSTNAIGDDLEKLIGELAIAQESIGKAGTAELFFWLYGDLPVTRFWLLTGGLGIGLSSFEYELSWNWTRHDDVTLITTGANQPNVDEIRMNLAGTSSIGNYDVSDRLFGFGLHASIARSINANTAIGVEANWKRFGELQSTPFAAGTLRGHESNLRLDGSQPVATWTQTKDTERTNVELFIRRYF